jgi:hypothetical protein
MCVLYFTFGTLFAAHGVSCTAHVMRSFDANLISLGSGTGWVGAGSDCLRPFAACRPDLAVPRDMGSSQQRHLAVPSDTRKATSSCCRGLPALLCRIVSTLLGFDLRPGQLQLTLALGCCTRRLQICLHALSKPLQLLCVQPMLPQLLQWVIHCVACRCLLLSFNVKGSRPHLSSSCI